MTSEMWMLNLKLNQIIMNLFSECKINVDITLIKYRYYGIRA